MKTLPLPSLPHADLAIVLCNGPSMRGIDFAKSFEGYTTFGMNLAYRHWDAINWHPTYYSCLDRVVGMDHLEDIERLVSNAPIYGIEKFLLRHNVVDALQLQQNSRVLDFDAALAEDFTFFRGYWASTGSITTAWAASLGYRHLLLFGADASYHNYVSGAVHVSEFVLKIEEQPVTNPNYFIDDYQRMGDMYHKPFVDNPEAPHEDQLLGWHMIRPQLHNSNTVVVNVNPQSRITAFPLCPLSDAPHAFRLTRRRARHRKTRPALTPDFPRKDGVQIDTAALAAELCARKNGPVIDVGAYHGANCLPFLAQGRQVYAIEADSQHGKALQELSLSHPGLHVVDAAMSCVHGRTYPWHRHARHDQFHAMKCFSDHCLCVGEVTTTTLRHWCKAAGIAKIGVLMCDVSGFELMVLRGADLTLAPPECIVCAWDNLKSIHLKSDRHDLGSFLLAHGYQVFMSEWHPVLDPALPQQWKGLYPYPVEPAPLAWGHFLAFKTPIRPSRLQNILNKHVNIGAAMPVHPLPPAPQVTKVPYVFRI